MTEHANDSKEPTQPKAQAEPRFLFLGWQNIALYLNPKVLNWSALFFAVLQSVCSAFIALNGVRLLIGVGAFALASSALKLADRMHIAAIRIPMMILALAGSLLNLVVLWQVWRLRRRPSSAWRQKPVPKRKLASEWFQFALSVLTLFLLAAEFVAHRMLFGNR